MAGSEEGITLLSFGAVGLSVDLSTRLSLAKSGLEVSAEFINRYRGCVSGFCERAIVFDLIEVLIESVGV